MAEQLGPNLTQQKQTNIDAASALKSALLGAKITVRPEDVTGPIQSIDTINPNLPTPTEIRPSADAELLQRAMGGYLERYDDRNKNSWIKDNEIGTATGNLKQFGTDLIDATSMIAGQVGAGVSGLNAMKLGTMLDDRAIDLLQRQEQIEGAQGDIKQQRKNLLVDSITNAIPKDVANKQLDSLALREGSIQQLTPEETEFLNSKPEGVSLSRRELIERHRKEVATSENIKAAVDESLPTGKGNPLRQEYLAMDIAETTERHAHFFESAKTAWDSGNKASAVGDVALGIANMIVDGGGDLAENPGATFEIFTQVVPQIGIGIISPAALAATNIGYATDIYTKEAAEFQKEFGRAPKGEENTPMLAAAITAALLDQVGEASILKGLGKSGPSSGLGKGVKEAPIPKEAFDDFGLGELLAETGKDTVEDTRAGMLAKLANIGKVTVDKATESKVINNGLTRAGASLVSGLAKKSAPVVKGTVTEGLTGGAQTYLEEHVAKRDYVPDSNEDRANLLLGTLAEAVGGAGASAGIAATRGAADGVVKSALKSQSKLAQGLDQEKVLKEATETGNVDKLVKGDNPRPDLAVNVLQGRQENEAIPVEQRAKEKEQINTLVDEQTELVNGLALKEKTGNPEFIKKVKDEIAAIGTRLQEDKYTSPELKAEDAAAQTKQNAILRIAEVNARDYKDTKKQLATAQGVLTSMSDRISQASTDSVKAAEESGEIESTIEQVKSTEDTPERAAAADKVINLMMATPGSSSWSQGRLEEFYNDESNGFNPEQRDYIKRFSEAQIAAREVNDSGDTRKEIFHGKGLKENESKGLNYYRDTVTKFVGRRNWDGANKEISSLSKFANSHSQKAAAMKKGSEMVEAAGGKAHYLVRTEDTDNLWEVRTEKPAGWDKGGQKENGGLTLYRNNHDKLTTAIGQEAKAIETQLAQLSSMVTVARNSSKATPSQVTEAPTQVQETPVTQSELESTPVSEVIESGPGDAELREAFQNKEASEQSTPVPESTELAPSNIPANEQPPVPENEYFGTNEMPPMELPPVDEDAPITAQERGDVPLDIQGAQKAEPGKLTTQGEPTQKSQVVIEDGTLDTLKKVEGAEELSGDVRDGDYQKANLVSRQFTQSGGKEGSKTLRPLVAVKNFVSTVMNNPTSGVELDYIDGPGVGKEQGNFADPDKVRAGLNAFFTFANDTREGIMARMAAGNKTNKQGERVTDYDYKDYAQFIEGEKSENVATAIASAAYNWVATNNSQRLSDRKKINRMFGRQATDPLQSRTLNALANVGMRRNMLIQELGQAAVAALGIQVRKDAPADAQLKLEMALGNQVYALMLTEGLIYESNVPIPTELAEDKVEGTSQVFVQLTRASKVEKMAESVRGTQGALERMFGVQESLRFPTSEPVKLTKTKTKRTKEDIPNKLVDSINKANAEAYHVNEGMEHVIGTLDEQTEFEVHGGESTDGAHALERESILAQNEALKRELGLWNEFRQSLGSAKDAFYFAASVWRQQRAGLEQNAVNPQQNKSQRFLMVMGAARQTISMKAGGKLVKNFELAVAQAIGIKTDRQLATTSRRQLAERMADDAKPYKAAVEALQAALKLKAGEKLSPEQQAAVLAAVKKGDEAAHTLAGLTEWAKMLNADGGEFVTELGYEVDGITNGPALALIQLGAIAADISRSVGIYLKGDVAKSAPEWKEHAGNRDIYEKLMAKVDAYVGANFSSDTGQLIYGAIQHFTSPLVEQGSVTPKGRKLVKQPLTSMVFGAGIPKVVRNMAAEFAYNANIKLADATELKTSIDSINSMIAVYNTQLAKAQAGLKADPGDKDLQWAKGKAPASSLRTNMAAEAAVKYEFTEQQSQALEWTFEKTIGAGVTQALEEDYGDFIKQRQQLNSAAQMSWKLYDSVYKAKYAQKLAELNDLPKNAKGLVLTELPPSVIAEIETELAQLNPLVHTALSKSSGQFSAGLRPEKKKKGYSDKSDSRYVIETVFKGLKIPTNGISAEQGGKFSFSKILSQPFITESADPGVGTVIMLIHALDSAIASGVYGEMAAMNIHDALLLALGDLEKGATALNEQTFKQMLNYSAPMEIASTLDRVYTAAIDMAKSDGTVTAALQETAKYINSERKKRGDDPISLEQIMADTFESAIDSRTKQLDYMTEIGSVNQYGAEGGNYVPDANDATAIEQQKTELAKWAERRKVESSNGSAKYKKAPDVTTDTVEVEAQAPGEKPANRTTTATKTPAQNELSDLPWVDGEITVKEIVPYLLKAIKASSSERVRKGQQLLLKQILAIVPADLAIIQVTDADLEYYKEDLGDQTPRGWYHKNVGREYIAIMSTDSANPGMRVDTLMHELLHAATAQTLQQERQRREKNPKYHSEALTALEELEALLNQSTQFAADNGLTSRYGPALKSVDELISWGLTDAAFQRDILSKLKVKDSKFSGLISGMRKFSLAVIKALFKGSAKNQQEVLETGLSALIIQTSAILGEARNGESDPNQIRLFQENTSPDQYTTAELFTSLGENLNVPIGRQEYLGDLLGDVVDRIYGGYGALKVEASANTAATAMDAFTNAVTTGQAPFASAIQGNVPMNSQELFVAESLEIAMKGSLDKVPSVQKELRNLYRDARRDLKGVALHSDPAVSQAVYDFIFNAHSNADGQSDYLSRFASLGMVYEPLQQALGNVTRTTELAKGTGLGARLQNVVNRVLQFMRQRLAGIGSVNGADAQVKLMAKRLAEVEAKHRTSSHKASELMQMLDKAGQHLAQQARKGISKAGKSELIHNSRIPLVPEFGRIAAAVADEKVGEVMDVFMKYRDQLVRKRHGFMASLVDEARGPTWAMQKLGLMANDHQKARQQMKEAISGLIRDDTFVEKLDKAQSEALTRTVLRLDMGALDGVYSLEETARLVSDPRYLKQQIDKVIRDLGNVPADRKNYYIAQAQGLGHFLATSETSMDHLMLNAHSIAHLAGVENHTVSEADAQSALPHINVLVTLYGLKRVDSKHKAKFTEVFTKEQGRPKGEINGLATLMQLQKVMREQAANDLFRGNPMLMQKGYIKEIYNPNIQIQVARNEKEAESLTLAGYTEVATLEQDAADPRGAQRMFVLDGGGLSPYQSGAVSTTGERAQGSKINSGLTVVDESGAHIPHAANTAIQKRIYKAKQASVDAWFNGSRDAQTWNPSNETKARFVPILNESGGVVNYRYLMQDRTKAVLLDPRLDVDQVMGAMAASMLDKVGSKELNHKVMDELRAQYNREINSRPESYIEFGPTSDDLGIQESWKLLPEDTKDYVRKIWGRDGMQVRVDQVDILFGYRKFSTASKASKFISDRGGFETAHRNTMDMIAVSTLKTLGLGKGGAAGLRNLRHLENGWQELVRETKNNWVIKSLDTFLGNVSSNVTILLIAGVPPWTIAKHHATAITGALNYGKDMDAILKLEALQKTGLRANADGNIEQQLVVLRDAIQRNPVRELVEAGMLQTIVEDVSIEHDDYSYKSKLVEWGTQYTDKAPKWARESGKFLYMAQDTPLYKFMSQGTHLSDFAARYTLHQHQINRRTNKLSPEESFQRAMDYFVNYDIPTHKGMQYMNDMGLLFFTKYYLRIQRAILQMSQENPLRFTAMLWLDSYFSGLSSIVDSGFWGRIGNNPFGGGAVELPGSFAEIMTVDTAMSVF